MKPLNEFINQTREKSRKWRVELFQRYFNIDQNTKILDLGSENGDYTYKLLEGLDYLPTHIYIADINAKSVEDGNKKFGFTPMVIEESGKIPFPDQFFDIIFCSSVIEHVTISKNKIWNSITNRDFNKISWIRQKEFAGEIKRLGKSYFVQTPNKWFPIESHTWLPLAGFLPRFFLLPVITITNRFWIKKTNPDWRLISRKDFTELFPEAQIILKKNSFS